MTFEQLSAHSMQVHTEHNVNRDKGRPLRTGWKKVCCEGADQEGMPGQKSSAEAQRWNFMRAQNGSKVNIHC